MDISTVNSLLKATNNNNNNNPRFKNSQFKCGLKYESAKSVKYAESAESPKSVASTESVSASTESAF